MDATKACPERGRCHVACRKARFSGDAPEVRARWDCGPRGLVHTRPGPGRRRAAVVTDTVCSPRTQDFNAAFAAMLELEGLPDRVIAGWPDRAGLIRFEQQGVYHVEPAQYRDHGPEDGLVEVKDTAMAARPNRSRT
jgi:hypothetical protein